MHEKDILTGLSKTQVLAEIEDVIRSIPPLGKLLDNTPEAIVWFGRARAAINNWSRFETIHWDHALSHLKNPYQRVSQSGYTAMLTKLHEAQNDLRLKTTGPLNIAIGHGEVFAYASTVKNIIQQAKVDVFFIDRYLNADIPERYFPFVGEGVFLRLLTWNSSTTKKDLQGLIAMSKTFSDQYGTSIEIRSHADHHERYIFIDGLSGYSSGSSFKDGPRKAGATINQLSGDMFKDLKFRHEELWQSAKVEFKFPE